VRAGLEGIRERLPLPVNCDRDPADLTPAERAKLGIVPLPESPGEALDALMDDELARGWMPPTMLESYLSVKRTEIALAATLSPEQVCAEYAKAY